MAEKLCIFCKNFNWSKEEMWGMGSSMTGPMFEGGDARCNAEKFPGEWGYPRDEEDFRKIIIKGRDCDAYDPAVE